MLLKEKSSGHMVEVLSVVDLVNLNCDEVVGRYQEGEEAQDPKKLKKKRFNFPVRRGATSLLDRSTLS